MTNPPPKTGVSASEVLTGNFDDALRRALERRSDDLASDYQQEIKRQLARYREHAPEGTEVCMEVVLPGNDTAVVYDVGYVNPNMLVFDCMTGDGDDSRILAAHTHVMLRLRTLTPQADDPPRREIGFMAPPFLPPP